MNAAIGIALGFAALAALIGIMIAPSGERARCRRFRGTAFAHRGLYGPGAAENSMEAFRRAVDAGFGIEFDVQLSADGVPVIFHDETLARMTGDPRRVCDVPLSELQSMDLGDGCAIPTLGQFLREVNGRVPLLVELKTCKERAQLTDQVVAQLRAYQGEYIVESFDPRILYALRKRAPELIRGQLVTGRDDYADQKLWQALMLSALLANGLSRPDFISYNLEQPLAARVHHALFDTPLAAWTVRDPQTCAACISRGEMPIFEGFIPAK